MTVASKRRPRCVHYVDIDGDYANAVSAMVIAHVAHAHKVRNSDLSVLPLDGHSY